MKEDIPHRSLHQMNRALAHHSKDQDLDSIRICIPVSNRYGPLVNIHNDDDCDCGICNNCNEYELDDYIIYYNNKRIIKGNCNNNSNRINSENNIMYSNNNNNISNTSNDENNIMIEDNIMKCSNNNNININKTNNSNISTKNDNNIISNNVAKIDFYNFTPYDFERKMKFYFPNEGEKRYMRESKKPQDCTYTYAKNKDLCSIYLCDYLPLTYNAHFANELTINDKSSKYNKNYRTDLYNKCLDIRNKFFVTDHLRDYIYPIKPFKYKTIGLSNNEKVNKPLIKHKKKQ